MNTNQNQADPAGPILALLTIAATFLAVLWAGAQLAALTVHHRPLGPVPLDTFLGFVSKLPKHLANPAEAWPPGPWTDNLTGPVPYWASTLLLLLVAVGYSSRSLGYSVPTVTSAKTDVRVSVHRHGREKQPERTSRRSS